MKKVIIGLVAVLAVIIIGFVAVNGKAKAEESALYDESTTATVNDVFKKSGENIYYFYQPECHFCNNAKPEVKKFEEALTEKTDIVFNVIDMTQDENKGEWYQGDDYTTDKNYKSKPEDIKSLDDLQIVGTPTMLYVKDNKVVKYQVGSAIFDLMNEVVKEQNLGITLDSSAYNG